MRNFIFLILLKAYLFYYIPAGNHNTTLTNFTFGSCYRGPKGWRQDIFQTINQNKPQLWLWLGDAAYVDNIFASIVGYYRSTLDIDEERIETLFNYTKFNKGKIYTNNLEYQELYKIIPTIGIWDDHDYALNDGNGYFLHKEIAKKYYLDFIDEPVDSVRRTLGRGIHTTYSFGDPKTHRTVRIILLDIRFHKQSYFHDEDPDMMDEEQWEWFEKVLAEGNETFTFIGSGTQILPVTRQLSECWYLKARKRLFDVIGKLKKSGVVLLSGDIHTAQILKTFCTLPGKLLLTNRNWL
jgi:alkaline phosphatase D